MKFTKQTILDADIDVLRPQDKQYLLEKYFPETLPDWKIRLQSIGKDLKNEMLWFAYQGKNTLGEFDREYRYAIQQLKILAEIIDKDEDVTRSKGVRVTDFTKWVMSL